MYRVPSARRRKGGERRLDLIPIMDAVFILIFFLLMSAQFVKIYEIGSDLPILADSPPPPDNKKEPLNLTLDISKDRIQVLVGNDRTLKQAIFYDKSKKSFDLKELHNLLIELKIKNPKENVVSFLPNEGVPYDLLVKVMDEVRWYKDQAGQEGPLFNQIVFDNLI